MSQDLSGVHKAIGIERALDDPHRVHGTFSVFLCCIYFKR